MISQLPGFTHDGRQGECPVCLQAFAAGEPVVVLPCIHVFHTECARTWLDRAGTCPRCRFNVADALGMVADNGFDGDIDSSSDDDSDEYAASTRGYLDRLDEILRIADEMSASIQAVSNVFASAEASVNDALASLAQGGERHYDSDGGTIIVIDDSDEEELQ